MYICVQRVSTWGLGGEFVYVGMSTPIPWHACRNQGTTFGCRSLHLHLQGCARQVSWLASEVPLSPFPAPCWVKSGIIHTLAPSVSWRSEFRLLGSHNKWFLPTEPFPQTLDYCYFVWVLLTPLSCPLTYGLFDNVTSHIF